MVDVGKVVFREQHLLKLTDMVNPALKYICEIMIKLVVDLFLQFTEMGKR